MNDRAGHGNGRSLRPANGAPSPPAGPESQAPGEAKAFEELRSTLLGPEQAQLAKLADPEEQVRIVADALPGALARRGAGDRLLSAALRPTVEDNLVQTIRRQPKLFADLLAPILAPGIRRAIALAFEGTMAAIQQLTEQTFTARGIQWRMEAWRTGVPVGEIALRHTLRYRVEQVFLIHRETGVLLQFVAVPGAPGPDSDMVSAMLTALSQFVSDGFKVGEGETIGGLTVGEFTLWVERGPLAYLAASIRGTPPADLREVFQDALDSIHQLQGQALEKFSGDPAPFEACRPELEACLRSESSAPAAKAKKDQSQRRRRWARQLAVAGVVAGLLAWGTRSWLATRDRREAAREAAHAQHEQARNFLEKLRRRPGLVVAYDDYRAGRLRLLVLRDPLADDPAALALAAGLGDEAHLDMRVEPWVSLRPEFVERRARARFTPPDGVTMSCDNAGRLRAEGEARSAWVRRFRREAGAVPGVTEVITTTLVDGDEKRFRELNLRLESLRVLLSGEEEKLRPEQSAALGEAASLAREAAAAAVAMGRGTKLEARGEMFRVAAAARALAALDAPTVTLRAAPPLDGNPNIVSLRLLLTDAGED